VPVGPVNARNWRSLPGDLSTPAGRPDGGTAGAFPSNGACGPKAPIRAREATVRRQVPARWSRRNCLIPRTRNMARSAGPNAERTTGLACERSTSSGRSAR
jgi:hypothetical protein